MKLSIVIPAYNEEDSLAEVVEDACRVLGRVEGPGEVLVLDDGSRDRTPEVLADLQRRFPEVRGLHHPQNRGVGPSLQRLYREACGELVFFLPADGQVPAEALLRLLPYARDHHVVVGRRRPRSDPWARVAGSWLFNRLVQLFWGVEVHDADSVTLYRREALEGGPLRARDLCVPVEILIKARRRGLAVAEVAIEHRPRRAGRAWGANPRVVARTLADLVLARLSPRRWGLRGSPPSPPAGPASAAEPPGTG